jgi:hypothetical protein
MKVTDMKMKYIHTNGYFSSPLFCDLKLNKDENLRVLGICGRQGTVKLIVCECSECKKDPELFKNGLFLARKDHIKAGIAVCGCGKVTFSNEQHEVKVRRKCNETGKL